MSDPAVVTELVVTSDNSGAVDYTQAMAAAQLAAAAAMAANDNLSNSMKSANDNARDASKGFQFSGDQALSLTNHLRQAAEAAYAFSPAFRSVANGLAVPALRGASTAITAAAVAMVSATNSVGKGLIDLGLAASRSSTALAPLGGSIAMVGASMVAFNPTITGVATSILTKFLPAIRLLGTLGFVINVAQMIGEAWTLAGARLDEYRKIADDAGKSGLSTEFFQRIVKGADDAKLPVDALQAALTKLNETTADKLGGSVGQNRIDELTKAGNFQGNSGVAQLGSASTTEDKFRAIVSLIDQAMQKGERLAALDVSKTFLGDAATAALAKDQDYLNKMLESADKIKATDLVSDVDVGNALLLQNRLDAAEKILSQRWHPIQDILTNLGIAMKGAWVNIVESMAGAVDWAAKLVEKLSGVPSKFWDYIQSGSKSFTDATGALGLNSTPESMGISLLTPEDIARDQAKQKADALLRNPANVASSQESTNAVIRGVFKDTSHDPTVKQSQGPDVSAYDRAEESLLKYIEVTKAAAVSTGQGVEAQERLRAVAQLTAAGMKDGLTPEAAKAKAEMSGLAEQAGAAALGLAKARVAADIKFNRDTAFLSQDDVQIAQQLKGLYPDVAAALNSVEASAIRTNQALSGVSSQVSNDLSAGLMDIVSGTKSLKASFSDTTSSIIKDIQQMIIKLYVVAPLMRSLQGAAGGLFGLGGPGIGETSALAGASSGVMGGVSFPIIGANAGGTDSWRGGLTTVNERGGEIMDLPSGTRIIPHDVSMRMANNDNSAPVVNVNIVGAPSQPTVTQQPDGKGGADIQIVFRDMVRGVYAEDAATGGPITAAMGKRFRGNQYGGS